MPVKRETVTGFKPFAGRTRLIQGGFLADALAVSVLVSVPVHVLMKGVLD